MEKILFNKKFLYTFLFITILSFKISTTVFAQSQKQETIIIDDDKMNNSNTTIEIKNNQLFVDGKKVVNELSDKNKNIKIIKKNSNANNNEYFDDNDDFLIPPKSKNAQKTFSNNKALLGVSTSVSPKNDGALVERVSPNSPAQEIGIEEGDVITKVDEKIILNPKDLVEAISKYKPNDKVKITFERNNQTYSKTATLQENELNYNYRNDFPPFEIFPFGDDENTFGRNFKFQYPPLDEKPKIGIQIENRQNGKGVLVTDVVENSEAAKAGIEKDDIIRSFDNKDINDVDELLEAVNSVAVKNKVNLDIERNGVKRQISLNLPQKIKKRRL